MSHKEIPPILPHQKAPKRGQVAMGGSTSEATPKSKKQKVPTPLFRLVDIRDDDDAMELGREDPSTRPAPAEPKAAPVHGGDLMRLIIDQDAMAVNPVRLSPIEDEFSKSMATAAIRFIQVLFSLADARTEIKTAQKSFDKMKEDRAGLEKRVIDLEAEKVDRVRVEKGLMQRATEEKVFGADSTYLTNGYLDTAIDWIPGMPGIKLKELPTFIRTTDPNDIMLNFAISEVERVHKSSALILNTYDALEQQVLDSLRSMMQPPIYTIGPLHMLLDQIPRDHWLNSLGSNLWKEEPHCLQWLDSKEPNSVIYVNFGSVTVMTSEQSREFAWGLANSKRNFLWAIRPDIVIGEASILPEEFVEETKERGLLISWCPQEDVLKHPSISGFLTHCGWNSTFESICAGVPMICWPFFAEQQTNCWYCCKHLGIGIETNSNLGRHEVEVLVNELMVGDKGKELRSNATKLKKLALEAITPPNGTSFNNVEELISKVLFFPNKVGYENT